MPSSRDPSPMRVPRLGVPRKLSLTSARKWVSQNADGDAAERPLASPRSFRDGTLDAPLPAFLRKDRTGMYNAWVDLEWQQRARLAQGQQHPQTSQYARTSGGGDTLLRNRYANVEVFERNRIKLKVGSSGNDFVNASPIALLNSRYISTQGPKESSVSHFYRMLADETGDTAVVVMLTQTHEAGREKCFPYWPAQTSGPQSVMRLRDADEEDVFEGELSNVSTREDTTAKCTVTRLKLTSRVRRQDTSPHSSEPPWRKKEVYHLLFTGWPDFAIPEGDDRDALLELIRLSRELNKCAPPHTLNFPPIPPAEDTILAPDLNPRVVHCSAGVGRSGTFIALDYLLKMLDAGRLDSVPDTTDPIVETVDRMRQQRMMMVQGEAQFFFIYDVLREQWTARWQKTHHPQTST